MKQPTEEFNNNEEWIFNAAIKYETVVQYDGQVVKPADYFPVWLNNLADDVTLEGSLLNGYVQGPEAIRSLVLCIKKSYDRQDFTFAGHFNDNIFLESYTGWFQGTSVGCLVVLSRNAVGQIKNIAVGYRPLSALQLLSRLAGEQLANTPIGRHFST